MNPRSESHAYEAETTVADNDQTGREAWIGTDSVEVSRGNVSWGAIIAGVVTFLGIMILLGVGAAAMGLQGSSSVATGIFALISLAVAFAAGGYVSGALGVRAGVFHGFATWATSLIASLVLAGWLGASVVGGLGSALGSVAQSAGNAVSVTSEDAQAAQDSVDPQQAEQAQQQARDAAGQAAQQAQQTYNEVAPQAAEGSWWTFFGLIVGAVISSLAGAAGSRSVLTRTEEQVLRRR
ncbi:hypothetical protein C3E79_09780 [Corynebacterium liangguodongii]|uniref:Uncharacterized protein n=1 Tax=Corynebacterium liangguodongii TaxID=2079535 RepID=A0A2S0WHB2_9CORY|nr:hypothetical protein C3E79_09780 [Corynebacterium liangguodongii]PWB99778.1 hypothetical protein DF219_05560 [Corynebacterium liangguodongii]